MRSMEASVKTVTPNGMTIRSLSEWAELADHLQPDELHTLMLMTSRAHPTTGLVRETQPEMARAAKVSVMTIQRRIDALIALGYVEVVTREGRCNVYRVHLPTDSTPTKPEAIVESLVRRVKQLAEAMPGSRRVGSILHNMYYRTFGRGVPRTCRCPTSIPLHGVIASRNP